MPDSRWSCSRTGSVSIWLSPLALVGALAAAGCATTQSSPSQTGAATDDSGYVQSGGQAVRSGSGECVRTGYWTESHANEECDPALVARNAPPQPPETAAAEPAETAPASQAESAEGAETQDAQAQAAPEPVRVYIGADAFFEFDKAELSSNAQQALDRIVERANRAEEADIRIIGHADQIGPEDYNRTLSERRAKAVQSYLIEQGVPEDAVHMDARGEGDPVVRCEGRSGETLVECLQPNRRTEIELSALESVE